MNFLELARRVHREAGRSGDGPTSIATANKDQLRLFDWVNDAWIAVQSMPREWQWMLRSLNGGVTPAAQAYAGSDLGAVGFGRWRTLGKHYTPRAFDPANPQAVWRLLWMAEDQFVHHHLDTPMQPGPPRHWSISRNEALLIGPTPDKGYTVKADYLIEPVNLVADTDAPTMPARSHMLLVWRALCEVAKYDAAPELLARATFNHDTMLADLIGDQAPAIDWQVPALGGSLWASEPSRL